jgi:phenylalanyl-tRNA synthetase beta chain
MLLILFLFSPQLTFRVDPTYFPGHAASIHLNISGTEQVIGSFGILHPTVLEKFELRYPVSTLEINIEAFL